MPHAKFGQGLLQIWPCIMHIEKRNRYTGKTHTHTHTLTDMALYKITQKSPQFIFEITSVSFSINIFKTACSKNGAFIHYLQLSLI